MSFFRLPVFAAPFLALTLQLAQPELARARAEEPTTYTKTQTFRAALRYLRVDLGYKVVEKDKDSGYLLFEYPQRDRGPTSGSIEVIERERLVALIVQLPQMPSYHERHLLEGLLKKLRTDYGDPPRLPEPHPPKRPRKAPRAPAEQEQEDTDQDEVNQSAPASAGTASHPPRK